MHISVFGTVFMDCKGFSQDAYEPAGTNLGMVEFVQGGVGRNVAENLAKLSVPVGLVALISPGGMGQEVLQRLQACGVADAHCQVAEKGMGMWLAVMDKNGELQGSISQMPQLEALETLVAAEGAAIIDKSSHVVLEIDLNDHLAHQVLELAEKAGKPVYGLPGNMEVVLRNRNWLQRLACFVCNQVEAGRLANKDMEGLSVPEIMKETELLVKCEGMNQLVVTLGAEGSVYCKAGERPGYQPPFSVSVLDTSGAGDSFFSGMVKALVCGRPLPEAVMYGSKIAGQTLQVRENNCPPLSQSIEKDIWLQAWERRYGGAVSE